ncbi:hypothetical protein M4S82_02950 [Planococcus sp. MERTA32b]|nr:hypothetical protein [Planococcus sp. MER TA 32b]
MTDRKNNNDAQEKGFNSGAAYGDPKENTRKEQSKPVERNEKDSPFHMDPDGNLGTGDGETGNGIHTGQRTDDLAAPGENLMDQAKTGRNRGGVPMMDRQIEDVPANDPNAADAGPINTGQGAENIRKTDSVINDLASIDVSDEGLPANDQAESEVPPADPSANDVPDADRSMSDSTGHLAQNAADRTRRNDDNERK